MTAPVAKRILLAEDNPQDHFLLREAFSLAEVDAIIHCIADGDQLFNELRTNPDSGYDLVLLDAHLPRRSALDILNAMKASNLRVSCPIVILTAMVSRAELGQLHDLGVHSVMAKPLDLNDYIALARALHKLM